MRRYRRVRGRDSLRRLLLPPGRRTLSDPYCSDEDHEGFRQRRARLVDRARGHTVATRLRLQRRHHRDEDVKAAWAEVENQYKRRADLVPNLVKTVKGAANFEQDTLHEGGRGARQGRADEGGRVHHRRPGEAQEVRGSAEPSCQARCRACSSSPRSTRSCKATEAFRDLQAQLEGTENRIAVARERFVTSVAEYNKTVLRFPSSIGAACAARKSAPPSRPKRAPRRRLRSISE